MSDSNIRAYFSKRLIFQKIRAHKRMVNQITLKIKEQSDTVNAQNVLKTFTKDFFKYPQS